MMENVQMRGAFRAAINPISSGWQHLYVCKGCGEPRNHSILPCEWCGEQGVYEVVARVVFAGKLLKPWTWLKFAFETKE